MLLGNDLGIRVATYTAETPLEDRKDLLARLDNGTLQGLVAIRCLDEGVDVPSIRTAFILASSSNPRQFIQRRGRILRPSPGKDHAVIYDMVVVPDLEGQQTDAERNLMRRELSRYAEFADLAMNNGEARSLVLPFQQRYGLLDL
jgi:superfamily II DNA or RNA helicase